VFESSWIERLDNIRVYRRERFPFAVFIPVSVCLTLASFAGAAPHRGLEGLVLLVALTTCILLLFQFRLWDDIADRHWDRVRHPGRVLCGPVVISSFCMLVVFCGVASAAGTLFLGRLPGFGLLCGAGLVWYGGFSQQSRQSVAGRHVLLLKYPAFVWLIGPLKRHHTGMVVAMAVVYLCAAIYELLHDSEMRSHPVGRRLMVVEICALGCIVVAFGALGESL